MGEDIHQKAYVKSKLTGKYVQASELCTNQSFECSVIGGPLIDMRNYSLFSVFGSSRADWKELSCLKGGMPSFVKKQFPTEHALLNDKLYNFYGFCWATARELREDIAKYIEKLKDPKAYYDDEDDDFEREQLDDPDVSSQFIAEWSEDADILIEKLTAILVRLDEVKRIAAFEKLDEIFDPDDVVYMFWFDC